jgi:peptidoglycan/LPS O-acetylase OafA/YrhL
LRASAPSTFFDIIFHRLPERVREFWYAEHRHVFAGFATFLILAAVNSSSRLSIGIRALLSWRVFYPIAQLSYSLYLVHEMLLAWLYPRASWRLAEFFGPYPTIAADCVVALLFMLGCATLLYVFVERPSMDLRSMPIRRMMKPRLPELGSAMEASLSAQDS